MTVTPQPAPLSAAAPTLMDGWVQLLRGGLPHLRATQGWTQQDLAARSGLHRETIGRLERLAPTANRPSDATLTALASAFGYVQLSDLWTALHATVSALEPVHSPLRLTTDVQDLIHAYLDCTAEQQQYLRGVAYIYAARRRAALLGHTALVELAVDLDSRATLPRSSAPRGRRQ